MADSSRRINIPQVLSYLNHAFAEATKNAYPIIGNKNHKGTPLYKYQVDFCYLVHTIQHGPDYIVPKTITEANDLIQEISDLKPAS